MRRKLIICFFSLVAVGTALASPRNARAQGTVESGTCVAAKSCATNKSCSTCCSGSCNACSEDCGDYVCG